MKRDITRRKVLLEWLVARMLSFAPPKELEAAKVLWRHLLNGFATVGSKTPDVELALSLVRGSSIVAVNQDSDAIAEWLAVQILTATSKQVVGAAEFAFEAFLTNKDQLGFRRAAENALVWMVLHTRSSRNLSRRQSQSLLPANELQPDRLDWAVMMLDKYVIRAILAESRWWDRCRYARRRRGFAFADEGVNFVWENIEKYEDKVWGFRAWAEIVLGNFWKSLHRKWKRELKIGSISQQELESLGDDYVRSTDEDPVETSAHRKHRSSVHIPPQALPASEMLSAADVEILSQWESIDGLLMGYETDLLYKIPADLWKRWVTDLKLWHREREILATPPPKRRAVLAEIIGKEKNTLAKRWQRLKPKLAQLNCVATILDRAGTTN